MSFIENCKSFVKEFIEEKDCNVCYLSVQNPICKKVFSGTKLKILDLKNNLNPLAPFLDLISEKNPSVRLVRETVAPFHAEIFLSYFKNGVVNENFDIVTDDNVNYERNIFISEIIEFIKKICTENYLVLNSQLLSPESCRIIRILEKTPTLGKFIFCFDPDDFSPKNDAFSELYENAREKKQYLQYYDDSIAEARKNVIQKNEKKSEKIKFEKYYNALKNYRTFLFEDSGIYALSSVSRKIDKMRLTERQKNLLSYEIALFHYYSNRIDEATLELNKITLECPDEDLKAAAMFFLSKAYSQKKMNKIAFKYALLLERMLSKKKNSPFYAFAVMQEYFCVPRFNHKFLEKRYFDALKILKKQNLLNNYIQTALNVPNFFIEDKKILETKILPIVENCIKISRKSRNNLNLSNALQWKGIVFSRLGKSYESSVFYGQSLSLRSEINDPVYIIRIRNGLSYEALIRSDYKKSYTLLNEYISHLDEISNYRTIINTLRNIALPLFYSRNFEAVKKLFQFIANLIRLFNLDDMANNSFLPEFNDMQIFRTFVDFELGNLDRARISLYNIENNSGNISDELYILLYFLESAYLLLHGETRRSFEILDESLPPVQEIQPYQGHIIVFVLYEFALLLKNKGFLQDSQRYFDLGFKIASQMNLSYFTKNKENFTLQEYVENHEIFEPIKIDIEKIRKRTNKDSLVNQVHQKLEDYRFLNKIMEDSTENLSLKTFIEKIIQSLFDYSFADSVFFAEKDGNRWKRLDSVSRVKETFPTAKTWDYCQEISARAMNNWLVFDEEMNSYFVVIEKFGYTLGIIISFGMEKSISPESLNILNIAISDIQAKYIILKQNSALQQISDTDELTRIYNRRALLEYIDGQNLRLKRYGTSESSTEAMAFAFIDMDNFKFYNDTYGHKTGDFLLREFAALLSKSLRKVDFVCRYGGDEFVVVIQKVSCQQAEKILGNIHRKLKEDEYFIPRLEKFLGKKLDVPSDRLLGFSAGICSSSDIASGDSLRTAIDFADKALYFSKKTKKGSTTIFGNIREKL